MEALNFNEKYRIRTKLFAVQIVKFYAQNCKSTEELRVLGKQLLRSGTSVAANFRAAARGRSDAENFAKICIVVEEIDETVFWLELIEEAELLNPTLLINLKQEATELMKIFAVARKNMKKY